MAVAELMVMPLVRLARMPPSAPSATMLIDLVMVTAPKPPGSSTLISPLAAVLEMAPAKVLQGAVRLQGLRSSPTPETQVRLAWAAAGEAMTQTLIRATTAVSRRLIMGSPSSCTAMRAQLEDSGNSRNVGRHGKRARI